MTATATAVSAAFPTVTPSTITTLKSFFDDLPSGSVITGAVSYGIYPVGEKRGKVRSGFVVVQPTLLELHKSAKDWRAKKQARHYVRFADVFNMCVQSEPTFLKGDCLAIMEPADTFLIHPLDSEYPVEAWLDWTLERARECRSSKLARPVFREEYFEAAWDVLVMAKPKFKKPLPEAATKTEDLAAKRPEMEGRRRLCICSAATSFLLFRMEAKPTFSVDVPFSKGDFIDLPMNVVSNYGCQERYFFVRVGRCSEIGSGELWMQCESGAAAKAMHERISTINLRESDRRRLQGIKINNFPAISSRMLKSRAHRERSHQQQGGAQNAVSSANSGPDAATKSAGANIVNSPFASNISEHRMSNASLSSRTTPAPLSTMADQKSAGGLAVTGGGQQELQPSCESRKSTISGLLPFRLNRSSIASVSSTHGLATAQPSTPHSPSCSSIGKQLLPRKTCDDLGAVVSGQSDFAEDYMDYTCETTTGNSKSRHNTQSGVGVVKDASGRASAALHQSSRQHSIASVGGAQTNETVREEAGDYSRMDAGSGGGPTLKDSSGGSIEASTSAFPLEATRSYVVGSADSSPSSMHDRLVLGDTCTADLSSITSITSSPRTYSLDAKTAARAALRKHNHHAKKSAHSPLPVSPLLATAKNEEDVGILGVKASDNAPSHLEETPQMLNRTATIGDAEGRSTADDLEEMRKRAHSLGSKSWGKHSRKASAKHRTHQAAIGDGMDSAQERSRVGSTGSGGSHHQGGSRRRNTNRSLASASSSAADPGHVGDFHQIDFDGSSCASIDSPMNRSRQSSVGVQLPISMRAALDSLTGLSARHTLSHGPASSRSHAAVMESDCGMPGRKRSVPEITAISESGESIAGDQQQRRRSTFDTSTASTLSPVMAKILEASSRLRKRQENVGGVGGGGGGGGGGGDEGIERRIDAGKGSPAKEPSGDDYMMMVHNPAMPPQRVISTIVESASSSPSLSDTERDGREKVENSAGNELASKLTGDTADYGFITGGMEEQLTPPQRRSQRVMRTKKKKEKSRGNSSSRSSRTDPAEKLGNDLRGVNTDYAELAPVGHSE